MGTKSTFFRAFVEGQTISDGRIVTAEMIDQAVETFSLDTYTPGINIEHLSGFSPEPPFNRYGDVIAVKAQTDKVVIAGKEEPRRALYAQVDALDSLVTLAKSGQKPFPSVELTGDYAGTKKVGLVGLAFTDNPASIATQKLQFSRAAAVHGSVVVSGTDAIALDFEAPAQPDASAGAFAAMKAFFEKFTAPLTPPVTPPAAPTPPATTPTTPAANDNFADVREGLGLMAASITALGTKIDTDVGAIRTEFGTIKAKLENTEQPGFSRPPAPGGSNAIVTDC